MSPIPRPVNCQHPRLVKLVKLKGEYTVSYRCELCGTIITAGAMSDISEREDELVCRERMLQEKEHQLPPVLSARTEARVDHLR